MITDILMHVFKKDPSVKRHLVKTLTWNVVGTIDTILLVWLITRNGDLSLKIGAIEFATKTMLYFFHERVWHLIKYGLPTRFQSAATVKQRLTNQLFLQQTAISKTDREQVNNHKGFTIWLTGLSASGKSSIAFALDDLLFKDHIKAFVLDGDNTRLGINSDLGFSKEDRKENIRRVAEICRLFNEAGTIAIASFISPFEDDRQMARQIIGAENCIEVFVDADIETCKKRDLKGLYLLAEQGKIKEFTGVSSKYEIPLEPQIHVKTDHATVNESVAIIANYLETHQLLKIGRS
ncbi:putative adenylyl-sulfate kinase [mine drainage metagenome]|uniref:adenylyl-sulfate kinase n=1 Tax=mine drainage metagenome TaxID=410659 RepID=A0A1J5SFB2_9ZZZZ